MYTELCAFFNTSLVHVLPVTAQASALYCAEVCLFTPIFRPAQMKILPVRPKHIHYVPRNPEPFVKQG